MVRISVSFVIIASFLSTILTVMNAFFLKKQFYPSVVYLTKSSTSMAVLYLQAAVISYLVFSLLRWIFFGQLRAAEVEHAQERVWHAIMETCLAFTVFRDDFSPKFVIQFVLLFFVKAFHWLADDRVDYMERSPVITFTFHARILGIISLLSAIDSYFISHAFFTTLMRGASAQIVFGFEYAVLLTMIAHITINYILHLHDLRSPHPWENKAVYMLYAELLTSFLRCALYLAFAVVMMKIHTFPLFAIRPFYLTLRAFRKAVNDVVLSRRAINAMNNLFPLATAQDLAENDNTCIICREEMTVEAGAKKLPCNHIFHPNCLRSWFQRQQTCPTCRTDILANRRPNIIPGQQQPREFAQIPPNIVHPFQFNFQQQRAAVNGDQPAAHQPQFMPPFGFHGGIPPQFFPPQQANVEHQQQRDGGETSSAQQQEQAQQIPPPQFFNPFMVGKVTPLLYKSIHQVMPPFGFLPSPPPPFLPFPQPPTLSGLSDAEVVEMEGVERRAVEARIQALRNIQVLLDAAMLQFQQYLSIATSIQGSPPLRTTANVGPAQERSSPPSSSNGSSTAGRSDGMAEANGSFQTGTADAGRAPSS